MGRLFCFEPAPADYPNHLADPRPERLRLPSAHWLLLLLVVLCFVPRAVMAWRLPGICPDGVLYVNSAKCIEAGQLREAFHETALNVYPVILAALHRLGLDWEQAAMFWGITVSSLVVLPLWGWVRRQFDDRVALVACLLYAVHTKFIEWSPEAMRDPTFWLLFILAIYWLWRAVTEIRLGWFIAAGAAIALASVTRIEGLFLLIPLALWTFWRWLALGNVSHNLPSIPLQSLPLQSSSVGWVERSEPHHFLGVCWWGSLRSTHPTSSRPASQNAAISLAIGPHPSPLPKGEGTARRKLLFGAVLCVALFPLALALVNVLWLSGHAGWMTLRFSALTRVTSWLHYLHGRSSEGGGDDSFDRAMTVGRMIWVFIPTMTRGLGPVFALLMFGGIWGWRRVWSRRDHQAMFCVAVVILCGIWVQLWYDKTICPRYALPIVLMASPLAALGFFGFTARLIRVVSWIGRSIVWSTRRQNAMAFGVFAVIAAIGLTEAMTGNVNYFESRRMAMDLGRWLGQKYPTPTRLVGPMGLTPIVSYYANHCPYEMFSKDASDAGILGDVARNKADVVLLQPWKQLTRQRCESLVERMQRCGLRPIRPEVLANRADCDLFVLVRTNRLDFAQKPMQKN